MPYPSGTPTQLKSPEDVLNQPVAQLSTPETIGKHPHQQSAEVSCRTIETGLAAIASASPLSTGYAAFHPVAPKERQHNTLWHLR